MNKFSELNLLEIYFKNSREGILIDVGAHEGSVSETFAKKNWKVLAFEPEEKNRKEFIKRHGSNINITCIPKAVTDNSDDRIPFYVSDTHYGIHSIKPFHDTHHRARYVIETVTLKDALEQYHIDKVNFLKVDTEGADYLALKGFDWNRIKPEIVMVEFMDNRSKINFNYTHHDMAAFMADKGYACYLSEWAPIKAYGIKGQAGEPHTWLQCVPYPVNHDPAWGNLIFVQNGSDGKFSRVLKSYILRLKWKRKVAPIKNLIRNKKNLLKNL